MKAVTATHILNKRFFCSYYYTMWRKPKEPVESAARFGSDKTPAIAKPVETAPPSTPAVEKKSMEEGEAVVPKKQIVPEFIKIAKMSVRYIQPNPAPNFIEFLQHLNHEDVDFVKIPVDKKDDALYLRATIYKLLGSLTGVHWDKIRTLITRYNTEGVESGERSKVRTAILNIMDLATYFAELENVEFIREPVEN